MSRSGYMDYDGYDDNEQWAYIRHRGAVMRAFKGARGQQFLRNMLTALDALPEKRLVQMAFETENGDVCALGAVAKARGLKGLTDLDPDDPDSAEVLADKLWIAPVMARDIIYENDENSRENETPEERFIRIRKWVEREIIPE